MSANLYNGWDVTSFKEHLIDYKGGASLKQKDFTPKGIRVIPKKAVKKFGEFTLDPPIFTSEEFANTKKTSFVTNEYLITPLRDLVPSGPHLGLISENDSQGKSLLAQGVYGFRLKPTIHPKYAVYLSNANIFRKEIYRIMVGSTQVHARAKEYFAIPFPLPPLPIQQKIATILDTADALKQKDKALIAKYEQLTQSLFLDMFGDPVRNPKGWKKIALDSLGKISSGSTPSRKIEQYYEGVIPWVKTTEVKGTLITKTSECISETALEKTSCKLNPAGSIIIAMYGQGKTRGQVGRLGIEATTNQACAVIPPSNNMNYEYLFVLLKLLYEELRQLGRGGNQPNLNGALVKSFEVISPPLDLQNQFAERLEAIEKQKQQAQASLKKSEDLFNCLLQKAFKGELVS